MRPQSPQLNRTPGEPERYGHGATEFDDPVPDVGQPGAGMRSGRVEPRAEVMQGELDVPVPAGQGYGDPIGVAVPDGVRARLLGDPHEGVLDGRGDRQFPPARR